MPDFARRAVSAEYWDRACPVEKRHTISANDAPKHVGGVELIEWWEAQLSGVVHSCVQVDSSETRVFDAQYVSFRFFSFSLS